jgi:tripartite-type tricarboxylate transporter receptor subunit TctC
MALPPRTPQAMIEAYRAAYGRTMQDPDFIERGKKTSEDFVPMTSADVEYLIRQLSTLPLEATDYMTVVLRKQGLQAQ